MNAPKTLDSSKSIVDARGVIRLVSDRHGYAYIENEVDQSFILKDNALKPYKIDHTSHTGPGIWEAVAAEKIDGHNSVAWKKYRSGILYAVKVYRYNQFWIERYGGSEFLFPGTRKFLLTEEQFEADFDGNGLIGFTKVIDNTPKIKTATINDNLVVIQFDRELNKASLNPSRFNIQIDGRPIGIALLTLFAKQGELVLRLAENTNSSNKATFSYTDLQQDQSHGVVESVDGIDLSNIVDFELTNLAEDKLAPVLNKAVFRNGLIELKFSEQLDDTLPLYSSFSITNKKKKVLISDVEIDPEPALVKIALIKKNFSYDDLQISYIDLEGNQYQNVIQDKHGNDLKSFDSFPVTFVREEVPLNVSLITVDRNDLTLKFERNLSDARPALSDFRVEVDGKKVKVTRLDVLKADRQVVLQLRKEVKSGQRVTLSYFPPSNAKNYRIITDSDGNRMMPLVSRAVLNDTQDTQKLELESADLTDPNTIQLSFNKPLGNTIPSLRRFFVFKGRKKYKIQSIESSFEEGILNLSLKKKFTSQDDLRLAYKDLSGNQLQNVVQDKNGTDLKSLNGFKIENNIFDEKPPEILNAERNSGGVLLSFDEELSSAVINKRLFRIKSKNKRVKISSVELSNDQLAISLRFTKNISANSDLVISYTDLPKDQKKGAVQDLAGNDLESIRNFEVTPFARALERMQDTSAFTHYDSVIPSYGFSSPNNVV